MINENSAKLTTQDAYLTAINLNKKDLEVKNTPIGKYYSYKGLDLLTEDCEFIDAFYNTSGSVDQGAIYRKLAMCLEGFNFGNSFESYVNFIVDDSPTKDEFAEKVDDLMTFITADDDRMIKVMKKLETLESVNGSFDHDNKKYAFTIVDTKKCSNELGISEEMLGYILGMLDEYAPTITCDGDSCTFKL